MTEPKKIFTPLTALIAAIAVVLGGRGLIPATKSTLSKIDPGILVKVAHVISSKGEPEMFREVHIPKSLSWSSRMKNLFQFEENTNKDVVTYLLPFILSQAFPDEDISLPSSLDTGLTFLELLGQEKPTDVLQERSIEFRTAYTKVINHHIKEDIDDPDPAEGYHYFGNQNYVKILPILCQSNPFWSSALTASGDNDEYLELISYSDSEPSDADAKYLRIMRTMQQKSYRYINVRFNTKDMSVNQVTSYETGKEVIIAEKDWNHYVSGATYNMFYYTNVLHTLIHVYHYYMTAAIRHSTRLNASLKAWADPYDDNIAIKYMEVVATLFKSNLGNDDDKVHTGKNGFGGTVAVMEELRSYLVIWGKCKTATEFSKEFIFKDLYASAKDADKVIKEAALLGELQKHFDNVEPYATELSDAMKANDPEAFKETEKLLTWFMSQCGEGLSSIDSISAWTQSMSMTGFLHGATLGSSRMMMMPEIMKWRDLESPAWDKNDINIMQQGTGVLVGMTLGRHVFTAEIDYEGMWSLEPISDGVKKVMAKYDAITENTKKKYLEEVIKRDDFKEYGWVLTDHCPDGFDGKQYTQTSYI